MTNHVPHPSLGRVLVERGVISEEQLETALAVQRSQGGLLGDILTARGWVTPLAVAHALAKQRDAQTAGARAVSGAPSPSAARGQSWQPLGTVLVEKGCIGDVQLKQALALQREGGGFLGEILVEQGWLTASDLVLGLAAQLGLDFDVKRAADGVAAEPVILPSDRPDAHFEVLEGTGDAQQVLARVATFLEATDFVFDEVLWQREADELEIVRVDAGQREVAWSYRPGETASAPKGDDLKSIFGYPVTRWRGAQHLYPDTPGSGDPAPAA